MSAKQPQEPQDPTPNEEGLAKLLSFIAVFIMLLPIRLGAAGYFLSCAWEWFVRPLFPQAPSVPVAYFAGFYFVHRALAIGLGLPERTKPPTAADVIAARERTTFRAEFVSLLHFLGGVALSLVILALTHFVFASSP